MTNKSPTWLINTLRAFPSKGNPPAFLAPTLASSPKRLPHQPHFSTTAAVCLLKRRRSVGNPHRGESALRRTGLRRPVGMSKEPLPQPVLDPKRRSKVQVDPNHGLWGFFNKNKKVLTPPQEDSAMGIIKLPNFYTCVRLIGPRSRLDCRRITAQILGRFTFSLVCMLQRAESTSDGSS